jgi:hypothetical protein
MAPDPTFVFISAGAIMVVFSLIYILVDESNDDDLGGEE